MVRLAQKRGMRGGEGDWKEFLNSHDPKFGANMSDPSKRSNDMLIAFLKTFSKEDDLMVVNPCLCISHTPLEFCVFCSLISYYLPS